MTVPDAFQAHSEAARAESDERLTALVARCVAGDQMAYAEFYDSVAPGVYRLAYSILLHQEDAEDVMQEALVYTFRNLHRYDPTRGAVRTWLYTITVSRCRNARRRKWLPTTALSHLLASAWNRQRQLSIRRKPQWRGWAFGTRWNERCPHYRPACVRQ